MATRGGMCERVFDCEGFLCLCRVAVKGSHRIPQLPPGFRVRKETPALWEQPAADVEVRRGRIRTAGSSPRQAARGHPDFPGVVGDNASPMTRTRADGGWRDSTPKPRRHGGRIAHRRRRACPCLGSRVLRTAGGPRPSKLSESGNRRPCARQAKPSRGERGPVPGRCRCLRGTPVPRRGPADVPGVPLIRGNGRRRETRAYPVSGIRYSEFGPSRHKSSERNGCRVNSRLSRPGGWESARQTTPKTTTAWCRTGPARNPLLGLARSHTGHRPTTPKPSAGRNPGKRQYGDAGRHPNA